MVYGFVKQSKGFLHIESCPEAGTIADPRQTTTCQNVKTSMDRCSAHTRAVKPLITLNTIESLA